MRGTAGVSESGGGCRPAGGVAGPSFCVTSAAWARASAARTSNTAEVGLSGGVLRPYQVAIPPGCLIESIGVSELRIEFANGVPDRGFQNDRSRSFGR